MKDFLYELEYVCNENFNYITDNILSLKQKCSDIKVIKLQDTHIQPLTKDSPLHLLRALYACKGFAICKENNESFITKENASEILGYKSDFANIFIYGKDSLSNEYIEARKNLYHSITQVKQEAQKEQERILQEQQNSHNKHTHQSSFSNQSKLHQASDL